jgi:phospholipid/cholesterol/gamma-HCH transport system substrate-binding protein
MQKQPPTLGRLLVMVGFALSCFGLLLFLWLAFGGPTPLSPKGYQFKTTFGEATQLAQEADVRISGVSVGKVKQIETQDEGRSEALIEVEERYAPIPRDTRATLRQKTLLGETYVELTPGTKSSGMLPEHGELPPAQVSPTVELDEIFRAFDERTRQAFQTWVQQQAASFEGRGLEINNAIGNLAPFAEDTTVLLKILNEQESDVRGVVRDTGTVFNALTARDDELRQLIENSNRVFDTTARRREDLQALFRVLPTFNQEATLTVNRLSQFARDTDPLIDDLRPAARELSPTLVQLSKLAPDLKALFRDLDPLITASERGLPALERFLRDFRPFLGELDQPLRQLNPVLRFLKGYRNELRAFFANTVAATQAVDRPARATGVVHYLRTLNPINPENLTQYPRRIGTNRTNPYELPGGYALLAQNQRRSFEVRHCGSGVPTLEPPDPDAGITGLFDNISRFAFGQVVGAAAGPVAAPPCIKQEKQAGTDGVPRDYPHVVADATAATARAAKRQP